MATHTTIGSGNWSDAGTWDANGVPVDNGAVVIAAGHSVLMNADTSGFANGLQGVSIQGHATTPGMLYFKDGTNGYLKIANTYNIAGTSGTVKGRLLINSDGVWGNTGSLSSSNTAIIYLAGTAAGYISLQYLDVVGRAAQPTVPYTRIYTSATRYTCTEASTDVNAGTDIITFTAAPPTAGTAVRVYAAVGATLPTPLNEYDLYYTRTISGNTCKLAYQNSDTQIIDITAAGSGTFYMVQGVASSVSTVDTTDDVNGDAYWSTTSGRNRIFLCDAGPDTVDRQYLTLSGKGSYSLTLSAATDSTQYPLARVYLVTRNVELLSDNTTSTAPAISGLYSDASLYWSGSIIFTAGTAAYGYAIRGYQATGYQTGLTFDGVICNANGGFVYAGGTCGGYILGCNQGLYFGYGQTVTTHFAGNSYAIRDGRTCTWSGIGFGNGVMHQGCFGAIASGTIIGGQYPCSTGNIATTKDFKSYATQYGFYLSGGSVVSGLISGATAAAINTTTNTGPVVLRDLVSRGNSASDIAYPYGSGINVSLNSPTQVANYLGNILYRWPIEQYSLTIADPGGTRGAIGAWNPGGYTKSATYAAGTHGYPPIQPPNSQVHVTTCQLNTVNHVLDIPLSGIANTETRVLVAAKQVATGFDTRATFQLVNTRYAENATGWLVDSWQLPVDDTNWQADILTYKSSYDEQLALRLVVKGGTSTGAGGDDTLYWVYQVQDDKDDVRPRTRIGLTQTR